VVLLHVKDVFGPVSILLHGIRIMFGLNSRTAPDALVLPNSITAYRIYCVSDVKMLVHLSIVEKLGIVKFICSTQ